MKKWIETASLITLWFLLPAAHIPAHAQSNAPEAQAKAHVEEILTPIQDIVLQGKLQCSLRRPVLLPFRGVITSLLVQSGQSVRKGEVLARYKLWPDVAQQIQRQLAAPQIKDLELALANLDKALVSLEAKLAETKSLVEENLAPSQSLVQIEKEIQFQKQSYKAVKERLQLERQLLVEYKAYAKDLLGGSLKPVAGSEDASVTAPISGQVVWIQSELREGLELGPGAPIFIIGVMDPMVIHAQIHESDIVNVDLGEKADITMESVPNRTFEATVSRYSLTPLVPAVGDPSYYDIELTIPNSDYILKEGFRGEILFRPLRTAESSSMKIISPNGLEGTGDQQFFWVDGKRETEIRIASPQNGQVYIRGFFWGGPSIPGNPQRHLLLSYENGCQRQLVFPKDGTYRIAVPVSKGPNLIRLRALDEPTVTQLPNGDTRSFIIGVRGLAVSAVN